MRSGIRLFLWLLALSGLVFCSLQGFVAVLILVILPAAVLAAICGAVALLRPSANAEADAEHTLIIFLGLCLLGFFTSYRFPTHLLWSGVCGQLGLMFSSGLLLSRVWRADREGRLGGPNAARLPCNGAALGLVAVTLLAAVPILILTLRPLHGAQVAEPLLPALFEVASYGFDGAIPTQMQPVSTVQVARNLGHPPRELTVAMGVTMTLALTAICFAGLALIGRLLPRGRPRRAFFAVGPMVIGLGLGRGPVGLGENALWLNEPWLIQAYGPLVVVALIAGLALFVAVRIDAHLASAAAPAPTPPPESTGSDGSDGSTESSQSPQNPAPIS